jgi:hypothetical protein
VGIVVALHATKFALPILFEFPSHLAAFRRPSEPFQSAKAAHFLAVAFALPLTERVPIAVVRDPRISAASLLDGPVEVGPSALVDNLLASSYDFALRPQAELSLHDFLAARANARLHIFGRDLQLLAMLVSPADQDMNVGIIGVVVIDSDPLETRSEIAFHRRHEIACVRFEIESRSVFG